MTRIIGIMAGKGGVGKTTVAVNLACAMGLMEKKIGLIDFNFTTSHLAIELGLLPQATLNNVLRNEARIENVIYPCYNISVIPASLSFHDLLDIQPSDIKPKIKDALQTFDFVLLDSAPGFGREALLAMQTSDELILVVNPTTSAIADAIKCRQLAFQLGVSPIGIVVNKYRNKKFELRPEEIVSLVELPLLAVIREDEDFLRSEAERIPFVLYRRNKAEEFFKLAYLLLGREYKKPSLLERVRDFFHLKSLASP